MIGPPIDRRLVFPGILAGGVVQLLLAVNGGIDIGLLVCVYAAETMVLIPLIAADDLLETFKVRAGAFGLCVLALAVGAANAYWTPWTVMTGLAMWLVTVGTWAWQARERRVRLWKAPRLGDVLLQFGAIIVGLLGLWWADEHRTLAEHGWNGEGAEGFGLRLVSLAVDSGIAPLTLPAVALIIFRTMNEVFLELYRLLGSNPSSSDAPSSSRTTA